MKKTAIITGASRGIGKAIAEEFARLDYNLCLISRHYEEIEKVSKELKQRYNINSLSFEGDVSDKEKINEIFFKTNLDPDPVDNRCRHKLRSSSTVGFSGCFPSSSGSGNGPR